MRLDRVLADERDAVATRRPGDARDVAIALPRPDHETASGPSGRIVKMSGPDVKAMRDPSGDHVGSSPSASRRSRPAPDTATRRTCEPSGVGSSYTIHRPAGDHRGLTTAFGVAASPIRRTTSPSGRRIASRRTGWAERSPATIDRPSGDHAGQ